MTNLRPLLFALALSAFIVSMFVSTAKASIGYAANEDTQKLNIIASKKTETKLMLMNVDIVNIGKKEVYPTVKAFYNSNIYKNLEMLAAGTYANGYNHNYFGIGANLLDNGIFSVFIGQSLEHETDLSFYILHIRRLSADISLNGFAQLDTYREQKHTLTSRYTALYKLGRGLRIGIEYNYNNSAKNTHFIKLEVDL